MSASPIRTTALGWADSFNPGSAGFSSGFCSAGLAAGFGLPSGNAVLNLPVRRSAREYSVPVAAKVLAICPGAIAAIRASVAAEFFEDLIRIVFVSPSGGVPVKAPASAINRLSAWAETTSSLLVAGLFNARTVGWG